MPSSSGFDPASLRPAIESWLAERLPAGTTDVVVTGLDAPAATGHSSETVLFDASWTTAHGQQCSEGLVLRTAPSGHTVFPTYDLGLQFRVMEAVRDNSDVPLPPLRWYEPDPGWIGNEFIVMGRVDGRVPPDRMPYTMEGWLLEAPPQEQRRVQLDGVRTLAAIHAIDWRAAGLGVLDRPRFGATGLDQQLGEYRYFLDWGGGDEPHHRFHEVADWLDANRPDPEPPTVLNWGDARIGNMIFRDGSVVAVLDWEMATLGPRHVDLAWYCLFERFFSSELGVDNLPGFEPTERVVADYCEAAGPGVHIEPDDLGWYLVWGAYRYALVMMRLVQSGDGVEYGFTEDDNPAASMLENVLREVA